MKGHKTSKMGGKRKNIEMKETGGERREDKVKEARD
jgi:hypothetical protein